MERKDVERKMMDMGFSVGNKGFGYIADTLEAIAADGGRAEKITVTYEIIAKKKETTYQRFERAIRHEIERYYKKEKIHPMLDNKSRENHKFTCKNFLVRLYRIIYRGQGEEKKKKKVSPGRWWEDEE